MRVDIQASDKVKHRVATKKEAVFTKLATASPAEIRQYVNNHVTDLASAQNMLANLAIVVGQLVKDAAR